MPWRTATSMGYGPARWRCNYGNRVPVRMEMVSQFVMTAMSTNMGTLVLLNFQGNPIHQGETAHSDPSVILC
jgi:hypothetical protein